jgi:hypothetical protein
MQRRIPATGMPPNISSIDVPVSRSTVNDPLQRNARSLDFNWAGLMAPENLPSDFPDLLPLPPALGGDSHADDEYPKSRIFPPRLAVDPGHRGAATRLTFLTIRRQVCFT